MTGPEDPNEPLVPQEHVPRVSAGFTRFARRLDDALEERNAFTHHGVRGEYLERAVKAVLRDLLPGRFDLLSGQVVSTTSISRQQDVVIVDSENVSSLLGSDDLGLVPIESVSGTLEIKTALDPRSVREAVRNVQTVKALVSDRLPVATGAPSMPFGGVVGFAMNARFSTIADAYVEACWNLSNRDHRPDALFVLGGGTVMPGHRVTDATGGLIELKYWNDGPNDSQVAFEVEDDSTRPTAVFLYRLVQHLIAYTPPPIDILEYGSVGRGDWGVHVFDPQPTFGESK